MLDDEFVLLLRKNLVDDVVEGLRRMLVGVCELMYGRDVCTTILPGKSYYQALMIVSRSITTSPIAYRVVRVRLNRVRLG